MSTFAVILNEPNDEVVARLKEAYPEPDHLELNRTVYLLAGDLLIENVIERLGFKGEHAIDDAVGIVLRLNGTYSGRNYRSVWDWLARAEEKVWRASGRSSRTPFRSRSGSASKAGSRGWRTRWSTKPAGRT